MSNEIVEVVALQFLYVCQVLLSVVFNKQEMKIAWFFPVAWLKGRSQL